MSADLEFGYFPLGDLKPNPRNARTHSKKQIAQIAATMTVDRRSTRDLRLLWANTKSP